MLLISQSLVTASITFYSHYSCSSELCRILPVHIQTDTLFLLFQLTFYTYCLVTILVMLVTWWHNASITQHEIWFCLQNWGWVGGGQFWSHACHLYDVFVINVTLYIQGVAKCTWHSMFSMLPCVSKWHPYRFWWACRIGIAQIHSASRASGLPNFCQPTCFMRTGTPI